MAKKRWTSLCRIHSFFVYATIPGVVVLLLTAFLLLFFLLLTAVDGCCCCCCCLSCMMSDVLYSRLAAAVSAFPLLWRLRWAKIVTVVVGFLGTGD